MTFWEHLEELRGSILRILAVSAAFGIVAFILREPLFNLVLAPTDPTFCLYQWLTLPDMQIHLVNTELAEQMLIHLKVAFTVGAFVAAPYILYVLFSFISPALYAHEKHIALQVCIAGYVLFVLGVVATYLLFFPITLRFLAGYQVSERIQPMLTLQSYADTLLMMCLLFGIVSELPVVAWLLGRLGVLKAQWMRHYRKHAIIIILIVAAVITPTADAFTLAIVAVPIWLLYELSILVVARSEQHLSNTN